MYMFREASGLSFESKGDRTMNLRYDAHATRWETALDTRVPAARFCFSMCVRADARVGV